MIEQKIKKLFEEVGLGSVEHPIESVSGGFLHRMFKVSAEGRAYAVKHLNPLIMKRPDAVSNFSAAEKLESVIEDAGIPIVAALCFHNKKMQEVDGDYFYIFDWHSGQTTDWYHITSEQCRQAGSILGRMHALDQKFGAADGVEESKIDFDLYLNKSETMNHDLFLLLTESCELLRHAEDELNRARKLLPDIVCISGGDMDPKNVMWENSQPYVIDLECLAYGNPVSDALQLSLQWSGATVCDIDLSHIHAFFDGYLNAYDNGFRGYAEVFGLAYTWLEWLEYNLKRALGNCIGEDEKETGVKEAKNTLARIRCLYENEADIKRELESLQQKY